MEVGLNVLNIQLKTNFDLAHWLQLAWLQCHVAVVALCCSVLSVCVLSVLSFHTVTLSVINLFFNCVMNFYKMDLRHECVKTFSQFTVNVWVGNCTKLRAPVQVELRITCTSNFTVTLKLLNITKVFRTGLIFCIFSPLESVWESVKKCGDWIHLWQKKGMGCTVSFHNSDGILSTGHIVIFRWTAHGQRGSALPLRCHMQDTSREWWWWETGK